MELDEIIAQLNTVFRKELDNDSIFLKNETVAKDIEEWDSLTNVQLMVAIEKNFKIRFTSMELTGFKNVGEMCQTIKRKLNP